MTCPRCNNENPTDYPVCGACARQAHVSHRECRCDTCVAERETEWLARARRRVGQAHSHLMALYALSVAFSDDPPMLADVADGYQLPLAA